MYIKVNAWIIIIIAKTIQTCQGVLRSSFMQHRLFVISYRRRCLPWEGKAYGAPTAVEIAFFNYTMR